MSDLAEVKKKEVKYLTKNTHFALEELATLFRVFKEVSGLEVRGRSAACVPFSAAALLAPPRRGRRPSAPPDPPR